MLPLQFIAISTSLLFKSFAESIVPPELICEKLIIPGKQGQSVSPILSKCDVIKVFLVCDSYNNLV